MKLAVTSKENRLDSALDPRFGRAAYILIVDTKTLEYEVLDNMKNKNSFKCAGIQAAAMVSDHDAEVLLTGFCGPNAFKRLATEGVKVVNDQSGRVINVVQKFKQGNVVFADTANKEKYW
ncbi:MAG: NifB/NifX family molybdenum-iron cluster-binding protein [Proteobacteria bacterium]|nr:dinitrogenase iron-molybdenum cofactor biosynthesis protein [Desulfobacula sp.]MBU3954355.1 NifB/NifX family molybdenum-iron cluster-binding protein [Pseudomonadota bacterium]MBU4133226.1 NifB/NifX family molybdenum-iron cluster-binding protein [Pseudomonadota bacterium]